MLRSLTILASALTLIACSDGTEQSRQTLKESIGLHSKLEFHNLRTFPGEVVCGEYTAVSTLAHVGETEQPFLTVRGKLNRSPAKLQLEIYCSKTPATVLLENTGIGPYDASNLELAKITADFSTLAIALESYAGDQFVYPSMEQGLKALVSAPEILPNSGAYPAEGYLESIPLDPWDRAYLYQEEQWGRTKGSFTLTTLGEDGIEGGTGDNADISSEFLEYLQHMAYVLGKS